MFLPAVRTSQNAYPFPARRKRAEARAAFACQGQASINVFAGAKKFWTAKLASHLPNNSASLFLILSSDLAPIKKRSSIRAKASAAGVGALSRPSAPSASSSSTATSLHLGRKTAPTKAAKLNAKHSDLMSRIEKSQKKPLKRRRPGKKLAALESLAEALPELEEKDDDDEWEGIDDDEQMGAEKDGMLGELGKMVRVRKSDSQKMKLKTLKSRPGAMKRKAKLEENERERFGKNLAQMNAPVSQQQAGATEANATSARWAALRSFIGQTMEQNAAFRKA